MARRFFLSFAIIAILVPAFAFDASANGGPGGKTFGLGAELGLPTGITGKVFLGEVPALAFGLGGIWPYGSFGGWFDVDFHFLKIRNKREDLLKLSLYAGPGIEVGFPGAAYYYVTRGGVVVYGPYTQPFFGIRGPFGFAIHWQRVTFDTFAEFIPALAFVVGSPIIFDPGFAIGGRYYF